MIDLSGVINIENMCASGINAYYDDGLNLYVLYGEEFKVLPNTEHNQEMCFLSIQQKMEAIEECVSEVDQLRRRFHPRAWYRYFLTLTFDDEDFISYYRKILFLRDHYEKMDVLGDDAIVVERISTENGIVTFEEEIADHNIFSVPFDQLDIVCTKLKKKKLSFGRCK